MRKVVWLALLCLAFLALGAGGAGGRTIIVDDPGCPGLPECYTLQDALNEAGYGELENTILVAPGRYVGNFYYGSSHMLNLMAMEGADPTLTILDGNENGTVLRLLSSSVGYVQVEGFTIRNGHGTGYYGGGIYADMPSGEIALYNNIITDNAADNYGGGIHAKTSSGYIELYNNIITENYALDSGGGVFIYSNSSSGTAGTVSLFENTITNNYAEHSGGGVYARSGSASGTVGSITFFNNVIASNLTNDYGGGVAASSYTTSGTAGTITFTNNTITGNTAGIDGKGGHLYIFGGDGGGTVNFYNNICWGNTGSGGDVYLNKGSGVAYRYNNDATISGSSWNAEDGNIDADPQFVGGGNYHLQATSPCIDTGLNSAPGVPATDFEGDDRIIDGDSNGTATVDMGADEFAPDTTPPDPNPMTWATPPYAASSTSIPMVATTATDTGSPPVAYYFDFVDSPTGGTGGSDFGWQSSTSYTDTGLQPNHQYGYQVKARDAASMPNETSWSSTLYAYTLANAPVASSFSNVTQTSIQANWTDGGNPSGTQYYCENTTQGSNSGWTTNIYWDSTGLACETSYSFRVKAKNGDEIETAWTDLGTQATQSCPPPVLPPVINPLSDDAVDEGTPYTGPTPSLSQGTLPVTWSLVSGPSGMGIDSGTGVVSWADPTASGSPHTITIQATNAAGSDSESWLLSVEPPPGVLSVTPAEGLSSSGNEGGPFSPSSKDYTLENTGEGSINWTASKTQDWVTLSATGGSLAPAASATVTVSINSTANSLTADTYNDTVTFTNTTNGVGNTSRAVMLTVESCPLPAEPTNPSPADEALDISITTDLDWDDSDGATSYDVYFGTTYPPEKVGTVTDSAYDPGSLGKNSIYYWRIVAKNDCGDTTGDLWQFTTAQQTIHIILHQDGALWSSETGWEVTTPPYYPGTGYARDLELLADGYLILHRDGAIYDSATGWIVTTPPYYPGTAYARDLEIAGSGEAIILHRDGALWSSDTGWTITTPPYYPGTAYAKALEVRGDASYVILHRDGAICDSATGWVMTSPPYYPGTAYAVDMKLAESGYVILHRDGAVWSTSGGWIMTAPPYYPTTDYARALELVGAGYKILHRDGAIYNSATGWIMTSPPYYPGTAYAVDLEVR